MRERAVWGGSERVCIHVTLSVIIYCYTYTSYTVTVSLCMDYLSIETGYVCVQIWQMYKCSSILLKT